MEVDRYADELTLTLTPRLRAMAAVYERLGLDAAPKERLPGSC